LGGNVKYRIVIAVKPRIIYFVGDPEKDKRIRENDRRLGLYEIRFVEGPQKLNNGPGKTIHPAPRDRGFAVCNEIAKLADAMQFVPQPAFGDSTQIL
jgi:hypothetical protein